MCFAYVNLNILVNGDGIGLISLERGFRQGDPISPYLFIIYMEWLIFMVLRYIEELLLTYLLLWMTPLCFVGKMKRRLNLYMPFLINLNILLINTNNLQKFKFFFSAKILFKVLVSLYPISLVSLNVWAYTNTFVYPLWWEERRKLSSNSWRIKFGGKSNINYLSMYHKMTKKFLSKPSSNNIWAPFNFLMLWGRRSN